MIGTPEQRHERRKYQRASFAVKNRRTALFSGVQTATMDKLSVLMAGKGMHVNQVLSKLLTLGGKYGV